MQNTVEITGGLVTLKAFVDRQTARDYSAILYEGLDTESQGVKIQLANLDRASDVLVLGMIESIEIGGVKQEISKSILDKIKNEDFKKLESACLVIMNGAEKKSEKSQNKPGNISKEVKA